MQKTCRRLYDEKLFKEVEPEDCPICFIPYRSTQDDIQATFKVCCGKIICNGCIFAMMKESDCKDLCPFCRTVPARDNNNEEELKRLKNLMKCGNGEAYNWLGTMYDDGTIGTRDRTRAAELYLKGGELGCYRAYKNLAGCYYNGEGVNIDRKKARHYYELAAINGDVEARHELGLIDGKAGKNHRAMKHLMIAARAGHKPSLDMVLEGFKVGLVTKDEYEHALRGYHTRQKETKSKERDEAIAFKEVADRLLGVV